MSDAIRGRIRPYLQNSSVDDEELINQMQLAVLAGSERKKKFGLQKKAFKVNEISVAEKIPRSKPKIQKRVIKFWQLLNRSSDIAEVKTTNYEKDKQKIKTAFQTNM